MVSGGVQRYDLIFRGVCYEMKEEEEEGDWPRRKATRKGYWVTSHF